MPPCRSRRSEGRSRWGGVGVWGLGCPGYSTLKCCNLALGTKKKIEDASQNISLDFDGEGSGGGTAT